MFISTGWLSGLLALTFAAGACIAEEPTAPTKFYKMEFVVKEVAGSKILNSRTYTTMVSTASKGEIRVGSKIPYAASAGTTTQYQTTQYQLIDVGVNFDAYNMEEIQDRLAFNITAEVSSVAEIASDQTRPTIRQNRWNSHVIIPLKKPTLLFSSDNVDAKTQMQIEVTATPIP